MNSPEITNRLTAAKMIFGISKEAVHVRKVILHIRKMMPPVIKMTVHVAKVMLHVIKMAVLRLLRARERHPCW